MTAASIKRAQVFEDGGAAMMARIAGNDGEYITQASISAIVCTIKNARTQAAISTPAVVVATSVFDTLQTDSRWTEDSTGYNFLHTVPATSFASGDTIYRVEYKFTPASGEVFWVVFEASALGVLTS